MDAPTSFLPPLKRLDECHAPQIHQILTRLVTIYLPKVRGTALIDEDLESLQADDFERSYAIRWLTGFIARGEEWSGLYTEGEDDLNSGPQPQILIRQLADFKPTCAGSSASGAISREFKFAPSSASSEGHFISENEGSESNLPPITISLQDESISTGDHTALLGCLTHLWTPALLKCTRSKGTRTRSGNWVTLSAGWKAVERAHSTASIDSSNFTIVATDYHPAVLENLRANVQNNFPISNVDHKPAVDVQPLDWSLYLNGKPTTDLSRAPSTVPTPAIGTPVGGVERNDINDKPLPSLRSVISPDTQTALAPEATVFPPIQTPFTPSFSVASSTSTPITSHSPQTPQTPQTPPSGLDQNSELSKKPEVDSPNSEEDFPTQSLDLIPNGASFDSFDSSTDFDNRIAALDQTIETEEFLPAQISNPSLLLDASRSELLCPTLLGLTTQGTSKIDSTRTNILPPCLDETGSLLCSDNRDATFNPNGDPHPTSSHALGFEQSASIGDVRGSTSLEAPKKAECLRIDSLDVHDTVGSEISPFKPFKHADGLRCDLSSGHVPQIVSANCTSIPSFGKLPGNNSIDYDPKVDIVGKSHSKPALGSEDKPGASAEPPFDQPFDIIFGADVVYEISHIALVRGVVERLLRKPSYRPSSPPAYFHLIMPLRPTHADEANSVDMAFPRAEDVSLKHGSEEILAIIKTETYARSAGVGRADEVQYVHYCVGWI
ncbi:Lysine methyltransferase [Rhizoctonia solani]|uniref:Lysine methyltransferase n=1 Tax=Rhizoctonia solani TaxID=456999 RepID=A0A8H7LWV9_9AGAM|nr:Lysine methyltransferase [Rhizoctonia solani]